jgi:hypothetical protein
MLLSVLASVFHLYFIIDCSYTQPKGHNGRTYSFADSRHIPEFTILKRLRHRLFLLGLDGTVIRVKRGSDKREAFFPAGENVGEGRSPPSFYPYESAIQT